MSAESLLSHYLQQQTELASMLAFVALGLLLLMLASCAACWRIFARTGEHRWKSLIPFYNAVLLMRIPNRRPEWWLYLE